MGNELSKYDYAAVDLSDAASLLQHAKKLEGHTFREILELGIAPEGISREYNNKRYKGGMGTLIEERYFGYKANNDGRPDFPDAGVELKSTCFDLRRDGSPKAGERLVLTMIPFDREIEDELEESHLWEKAGKILLIYYGRNKDIDGYDQVIHHVALFTPPAVDMKIIEEDYRAIRDLVKAGKAEELSEGKTRYLGACTKGATAATSWAEQFYPPHSLAKRRAFCFKQSYMDYVLTHYLIGNEGGSGSVIKDASALSEKRIKGSSFDSSLYIDETVKGDPDSIVKDAAELGEKGFEDYVIDMIAPYVGKTDKELCEIFGLEYTGNKAQWTTITYHMLGLNDDRAAEFEKANISARTVRIEERGSVKESLSLDTFSFSELAQEQDWEESELFRYFDETRFYFCAFRKRGGEVVFSGARFWSMPRKDIDGDLRKCWEITRDKARYGVALTKHFDKNGKMTIANDLPKISDKIIAHVRPHTSKSAYLLSDGTQIGDIERHGDILPDGQWMTKQSFWLNAEYIYSIVKDL